MQQLESITIKNGTRGVDISDEEIQAYVDMGREKIHSTKLTGITITLDGDFVDVEWTYATQPFQRIRRITGYLVGTLDRFNNAKRAEVEDRVKHEVADDCEDVYVDEVNSL